MCVCMRTDAVNMCWCACMRAYRKESAWKCMEMQNLAVNRDCQNKDDESTVPARVTLFLPVVS